MNVKLKSSISFCASKKVDLSQIPASFLPPVVLSVACVACYATVVDVFTVAHDADKKK